MLPFPAALKSELHPTKNVGVDVSKLSGGSKKKVWWLDSFGHEWEARVDARLYGNGCPFCSCNIVLAGFNDLGTRFPLLADELDSVKSGLTASEVLPGTNRKLWWKCSLGHSYEASCNSRTAKDSSCPVCAGRTVVTGVNDFKFLQPVLMREWDFVKNVNVQPSAIPVSSRVKVWWKCEAYGHNWEARVDHRSAGSGCPSCVRMLREKSHPVQEKVLLSSRMGTEGNTMGRGTGLRDYVQDVDGANIEYVGSENTTSASKAKQEIIDYFTVLGLNVEASNSTVLNGHEVDIYFPELSFAVDFNSLSEHNEMAGKGRGYHYGKWLAAKETGVQLVQVWEDDWNRDKNIILNGLKHKLGLSNQEKIFARKTTVVELTTQEAQVFLNTNHIQGFSNGSYYLGLKGKVDNVVRAVLVLKKEAGTEGKVLNIIRYATSANVVGGFTKLLSYATKTYSPESYLTFSDHTVSNGGLYENNNFIADKEIAPDYMYIFDGERKHKFGYRLKRFRNDPNLLWEEGLTERELAILNEIPRIWDAGKTRWVKTISSH